MTIGTHGYYCIGSRLIHREIMEKHIGRKLKKSEIVHHINENKLDNRIDNLQIMSKADHIRHHHVCNDPVGRIKWLGAMKDSGKRRRKYVGIRPEPTRLGMKWHIPAQDGVRHKFQITTMCESCKEIRWVAVTYKPSKCRKCYRHFLKTYLKENKIATRD